MSLAGIWLSTCYVSLPDAESMPRCGVTAVHKWLRLQPGIPQGLERCPWCPWAQMLTEPYFDQVGCILQGHGRFLQSTATGYYANKHPATNSNTQLLQSEPQVASDILSGRGEAPLSRAEAKTGVIRPPPGRNNTRFTSGSGLSAHRWADSCNQRLNIHENGKLKYTALKTQNRRFPFYPQNWKTLPHSSHQVQYLRVLGFGWYSKGDLDNRLYTSFRGAPPLLLLLFAVTH